MKFGKLVSRAEELLPDLKHLCLRYKHLKKLLKDVRPDTDASAASGTISDVKRLNGYFCDKEEEVVIWLQQLDEQLSDAKTLREKQLCHIGYIHLHGQLVLLFHWSMLNYAALVKILKKHEVVHLTVRDAVDKVSGMELKALVLSNALKQPFSTTGMLSNLMAKCDRKARELDSTTGGLDTLLEACPTYQGLFLVKETEAALDLWSDLRRNVSTPSTFLEPGLLRPMPTSMRRRARSGEPVQHSEANAEAYLTRASGSDGDASAAGGSTVDTSPDTEADRVAARPSASSSVVQSPVSSDGSGRDHDAATVGQGTAAAVAVVLS